MRDVRHALRSLRRSPGFVTVAVLALGLGLGLTTAMFGVIEAIRNPFVPFREPDRLYDVLWFYNLRRPPLTSFEMYRALRDETRSFDIVLPVTVSRQSLETGPNPGDVLVGVVPPRLVRALGVEGVIGRPLLASDAETGGVMISYALWRRAFAGRPTTVGSSVLLGGVSHIIVGIMPRGMTFPVQSDAWLAMRPSAEEQGAGGITIRSFVRLKPGVSIETARAEVQLLAQRLTAVHGEQDAPFSILLRPVAEQSGRVGDLPRFMLIAAFTILFIACANLANLMLSRGMARRRELALRMAVGASRWAIVRQQFVEAALITVGGMAAAVVAAWWGGDIVTSRTPPQLDWLGLVQPRLSAGVFLMAAGAAGIGAILFGLLPSVRVATRVDVAEPLKQGGTTTERSHKRHSWLVITEIALTLPLLVVAATTLKLLHDTARINATYAATQLLNGSAEIRLDSTPTAAGRADLERRAVQAANDVPGVVSAAAWVTGTLPGNAIAAEMTSDTPRVINLRGYPVVTPGYLRTLGLPVIEGRDFEAGDEAAGGAAIIDAIAARRLYPGVSAVGRMIRLGAPLSKAPWVRIVGVARVPELQGRNPGDPSPDPSVWVVAPPGPGRQVRIVVRSPRPDGRLAAAVTRRVRDAVPGAVVGMQSWLETYASELSAMLFFVELFTTMGLCALGLGAVGLYGVVAYTTGQRMREFAIRIALGASQPDVRRQVLHDATVMVLAGTGLGAVPAIAIASAGGEVAMDAALLLPAELLLIGVMLAACLAPARRAMRADPMSIIRAV